MSAFDYTSNIKKDRTGQYTNVLSQGKKEANVDYGQAAQAQNRALQNQTAQNKPWINAGQQALQKYQSADYNPNQFDYSHLDFYNDPSFKFRLQQGVSALDKSASARGKLLSGQQQQAVANYGQNLASQEYANAFARALQSNQYNNAMNRQKYLDTLGQQGQIMGMGYNAGQANNAAYANYGNALANIYGQKANLGYTYGQNRVGIAQNELARLQDIENSRINRNYGLMMAPFGILSGVAGPVTKAALT